MSFFDKMICCPNRISVYMYDFTTIDLANWLNDSIML